MFLSLFNRNKRQKARENLLLALRNRKTVVWDTRNVQAFQELVHSNNEELESINLSPAFYFSAIGQDDIFWGAALHRWRNNHAAEYYMCMNFLKEQPRQNWSVQALHAFGVFALASDNQTYIQQIHDVALLNTIGRAWLIENSGMHRYMRDTNDVDLRSWGQATVYSMAQAPQAFQHLDKLVDLGIEKQRIVEVLEYIWNLQERTSDTPTLAQKAWPLSNAKLNEWMDTDKQLPWWFDPINRESWRELASIWAKSKDAKLDFLS